MTYTPHSLYHRTQRRARVVGGLLACLICAGGARRSSRCADITLCRHEECHHPDF